MKGACPLCNMPPDWWYLEYHILGLHCVVADPDEFSVYVACPFCKAAFSRAELNQAAAHLRSCPKLKLALIAKGF